MRAADRRQSHPRALSVVVACVVALASVGVVGLTGVASAADPPGTLVFGCTGGPQSWVVPNGVTSATFDVFGAAGGHLVDPRVPGMVFGSGGKGGGVKATLAVVPGQVFSLQVGCAGANSGADPNAFGGTGGFGGGGAGGDGSNTIPPGGGSTGGGGGGGGASAVSSNSAQLLVAGGGGGAGATGCIASKFPYGNGGDGSGGPNAGYGTTGAEGGGCRHGNLYSGAGGAAIGNSGGAGGVASVNCDCASGTAGSAGAGGEGGDGPDGGGGGGGGFFGGGGAGGAAAVGGYEGGSGGGGGGNGFADPSATVLAESGGIQRGNGVIKIFVPAVPANPTISVGDGSILEGANGTRVLRFQVTLSTRASSTVTVNYAVTGDTATGAATPGANVDFATRTGVVKFAPGATGLTRVSKTVSVTVYGDSTVEPDETLRVTLSSPSGPYVIGRGVGTGVILNDDGIAPGTTLGLGDTSVRNADARQKLGIPLTLSTVPTQELVVDYTVTQGTAFVSKGATGGGEFGGKLSGRKTFKAGGPATILISFPLWGGPDASIDETFTVTIAPVAAPSITIVRSTATATIINGH